MLSMFFWRTVEATCWIGTANGLDKYNHKNGAFIHYWQDNTYKEGCYDGGVKSKYRINAIY